MTVNTERRHLLSAIIKATEQSELVRALILSCESDFAAESRLMSELDLDQIQARTVLDVQLRRLTGAQRQMARDESESLVMEFEEFELIAASRERQAALLGTDKGEELQRLDPSRS